MESTGSSEGLEGFSAEQSDGKDGRGMHVRIIGSFYTRSK